MKKIIAIMFTGLFFLSAVAQQKEKVETKEKVTEVPALVKAAFQKDYPTVKRAKWGSDQNGFEAEFKLNDKDCSANYNQAGERVEFEMSIETSELPKTALEYVVKNYPDHKISEAAKITSGKNQICFEAEVRAKGKVLDLIFDGNGTFVSIITVE